MTNSSKNLKLPDKKARLHEFKKFLQAVEKVEGDLWFIPVRSDKSPDVPKGESAKDEKWRLTLKEAKERIGERNVGLYPRDVFAVMDEDNPEEAEKILDETPKNTLSVSSRSDKRHRYFLRGNGVRGKDIPGVVELRTGWRYVLVPGSYAYDRNEYGKTGEKNWGLYSVNNATEPILLTVGDLPDELTPKESYAKIEGVEALTIRNKSGQSLEELREKDEKLDALLTELNPEEYDYPSRSEADMAVMVKLLQKGFDDSQVIHIVKKFRPYEKTERDDYVERTLSKAKEAVRETGKGEEGRERKSKLDRLIDLGISNVEEFFLDERDKAHAIIEGGGHLETRQVDSKFFKQYLGKLFYDNEERGIASETLNSAVNTLCAKARFAHDVEHRRLHNRVARNDEEIFYDLCNDRWEAVKITDEGWSVEDGAPNIFRRIGTQREQEKPEEGSDLNRLFDFVNIKNPDDRLLFKAYVVSCFVPDIPHPVLMMIGPHGSVKSFSMRFVKMLVDPSEPALLDFQNDKTETILQLFWHYMPFYDNLSKIKEWFSNLLCRASTGQGFMKRQLYTDEDPIVYNYRRCVGFNGIFLSPSRADLQDRLLTFKLDSVDPKDRKREEKLIADFDEVRGTILGAAFDILSDAMELKQEVELDALPRMADFALWSEAISRAMGYEEGEFLRAYRKKKGIQRREVLEENPVGLAVLKLMESEDIWSGTPTDLHERLDGIAEEEGIDTEQKKWPSDAGWTTRRVKEIETDLNREGVNTDLEGWKGERRWITLSKVGGQKKLTNITNDISDTFTREGR